MAITRTQRIVNLLSMAQKAGRIVLGLGYDEFKRERGVGEVVAEHYQALLDELLKKTQSDLDLLTIPNEMLPEGADQLEALNRAIRSFVNMAPDRVKIFDWDAHVQKSQAKQQDRCNT